MVKIYYKDKTIALTPQREQISTEWQVIDWCKLDTTKLNILDLPSKFLQIINTSLDKFAESFLVIDAAGGVVSDSYGSTLMIFRNSRWDLPKGKVEKGEKEIDASVREVREECGISGEIKVGDFICHTYHIYPLGADWVLKRCWWWKMACDSAEQTSPQREEGIELVKWVKPSDIADKLTNTYPTIRDVFASVVIFHS